MLWGDNFVNIHGRTIMSTVVLKLFAGQSTRRTDRQSGDYMLPPLGSIKNCKLIRNRKPTLHFTLTVL